MYASFAEPDGMALYGTSDALRLVADLTEEGEDVALVLDTVPPDQLESGSVRILHIRGRPDGSHDQPVLISANEDIVEIDGGTKARKKLAATLQNLASAGVPSSGTPRHLDIAFFPGHDYLDEESMWMTVLLLETP